MLDTLRYEQWCLLKDVVIMRTYYSVTMVLRFEQTSFELYIGSYKRHEDSVWILNTFTVFIQKGLMLKDTMNISDIN